MLCEIINKDIDIEFDGLNNTLLKYIFKKISFVHSLYTKTSVKRNASKSR